jgi:hypothetical protein
MQHMMPARFRFVLLIFAALAIGAAAPSCKAKYGCESNERVQPKVNRKGELTKKRRKSDASQLWDKKRRKRMGR